MQTTSKITHVRFSTSPHRKPPLKVGTRRYFKGTGIKRGWYELKFARAYGPLGNPIGYISNGRGGLSTEWQIVDPQPEPPNFINQY